VRACFALHGPRAADLLSRDPQAVVEELLAAIAQLESQARQEYAARREREARQQAWGHRQDGRRPGSRSWGWNGAGGAGPEEGRNAAPPPDRKRAEALVILELSWGASLAAVKAAHRRLVKLHHPDMGGDAESFRRINDAYQLLIA
ncbi:MAG: J domain-containing protein, partial [Cyanobacteriota bacterium]|jgi:DnaJ-domain-containing protein 1